MRWFQLSLGSSSGVVALPWTKSGARHGAQEIVTIDDPMVNCLFLNLRSGAEPEDLVYPAGAVGLRAFFPNAVDFWDGGCRLVG